MAFYLLYVSRKLHIPKISSYLVTIPTKKLSFNPLIKCDKKQQSEAVYFLEKNEKYKLKQ